MTAKLLTVELTSGRDMVEIHCNRAGLLEHIELLTRLSQQTAPEHAHLMTPSWAGSELSEEAQNADGVLINKVTVYYWPD